MSVDNRRHTRARVRWPVVIQTSSGLVNGKMQNLSLGGAFIRLANQLDTDHNLPLVLDAKGRLIPCNAQIVWSEQRDLSDYRGLLGIGVRFTRMMLHDREFLYRAISSHAKGK